MFERLRRLGRDLTGRSDKVLIRLLLGQIEATSAGLALARDVAAGGIATEEARQRMVDIEHRGDDRRGDLVLELSSVLSPPIDREDLFRLSRSVDDVLDNLRDLVNECHLYGIDEEPLLDGVLSCVGEGLDGLRDAVAALLEDPASVSRLALEAKKNDIRVLYQQAVGDLLAGEDPVTGRTMRRREVLRRVDVVGLRLGEAADALSDGAVKRSH
jgi:uncharacterized protein